MSRPTLMSALLGPLLLLLLSSDVQAQVCSAETNALAELHRRMRADVMSHQATAAVATWSQHQLEAPVGSSFEQSASCQSWAREVVDDYRFGCALERAEEELKLLAVRVTTEADQSELRTRLSQISRRTSVHFSCPGADNMFLLCWPKDESTPDAWCAKRVQDDSTLEIPLDSRCKIIDGDGADVMEVTEGSDLSCPNAGSAFAASETRRVRAERRGTVAAAGTFVALMAAAAVPSTFVPLGIGSFFRRLDVLGDDRFEQLRHNSYRARVRYLPLIGMTALSVSSLSSRFWWAGVLTAGCGISADVLLADSWRHGGETKRAIGIAAASVASLAGLLLDIETLVYSDVGSTRLVMLPTLQLGVARVELGMGGRF